MEDTEFDRLTVVKSDVFRVLPQANEAESKIRLEPLLIEVQRHVNQRDPDEVGGYAQGYAVTQWEFGRPGKSPQNNQKRNQ